MDQVSFMSTDSPPEIAENPQSRTVMQGYDATFTVNGKSALLYLLTSWQKGACALDRCGQPLWFPHQYAGL